MRETAHEWLKPLNVQRPKDRCARRDERERKFLEGDDELDSLLPAKGEVDELVELYLVQFEQLHRVLHVPTFRREYAKYWGPGPKYAAFTALILSIMAISNCLSTTAAAKFTGMTSNLHENAAKYIRAVEEWSRKQSHKHRKLIHYQIACLLYLAKRVNTYKKKRFWSSSGALVQDGIGVGLHRDPSHIAGKISPYNQEMRRRLWSTMQEFDLQTSYDLGLPTLLSQLHYDAQPPRNVDDEEFDEDSKELPPSKPTTCYTHTSYQHLSRQSLPLRLELSRFLTGPPRDEIDYDQVVRYTNDIVQEIDCLPSWTTEDDGSGDGSLKKQPLLSYTLLHIQLRQYIIPLHQPYLRLRKTNPKYQYSEIIYYNAARDIVLLHDKLAAQGIRALYFLREDILTAAMNLCHVTLLQPRGMSTNMIMINSQHTLRLVEKCLALKEDRILRCGNHEPWGYSIMCAALGLLETHLGTRTAEAAKGAAAERFVNLHYKLLAFQDPPLSVMAMPPFSSQQTDSTRAPIPSQESFMERAKVRTGRVSQNRICDDAMLTLTPLTVHDALLVPQLAGLSHPGSRRWWPGG